MVSAATSRERGEWVESTLPPPSQQNDQDMTASDHSDRTVGYSPKLVPSTSVGSALISGLGPMGSLSPPTLMAWPRTLPLGEPESDPNRVHRGQKVRRGEIGSVFMPLVFVLGGQNSKFPHT